MGDALSTAAVVIGGRRHHDDRAAGSIPAFYGHRCAILWSSFGILRETLTSFSKAHAAGRVLEKVEPPPGRPRRENYCHDLHVWSIGSETHAVSCHVGIEDIRRRKAHAFCATECQTAARLRAGAHDDPV